MGDETIVEQVGTLNEQAIELYEREVYREALDTVGAAWRLAEALPPGRRSRIITLSNLGLITAALGRREEAGEHYARAIAEARQSDDLPPLDLGMVLNNIAFFYQNAGDGPTALHLYQEAAGLFVRAGAGRTEDVAIIDGNLGDLYVDRGDYELARTSLIKALEIYRELGPHHAEDRIRILNSLAALDRATGEYRQADDRFNEAFRLKGQHPHVAGSLVAALLNNRALLLKTTGRVAEAEASYREVLRFREEDRPDDRPGIATALHNLGELYSARGDLAEAFDHLSRALELRRTDLGPRHPDVADSLNGLGGVAYHLGNLAEARSLFQEALDIREEQLPAGHPAVASVLSNLGVISRALGDLDTAAQLLERSVTLTQQGPGDAHPELSTRLHNLASVYAATDRASEALVLLARAADIDGSTLDQILSLASDAQRQAFLATGAWRLEWLLSLVADHLEADPAARRTALELVLRRKALGAEALAAQRDAVLGGRHPELRPELERLTGIRSEVAAIELSQAAGRADASTANRLVRLRADGQELEADLGRRLQEMRIDRRVRTADRQAVADGLPPESVLVELVRARRFDFRAVPARDEAQWQPARYLALTLSAGDPDDVRLVDLGDASVIDGWIASFHDALAGRTHRPPWSGPAEQPGGSPAPRRDPTLPMIAKAARDLGEDSGPPEITGASRALAELRRLVFDPLVAAVRGRTRLFVAPDGDLTRLPLEVLPLDDDRYVIDQFEISYLTVGREVVRFGQALADAGPPLVAADPDFDLGTDPGDAQGWAGRPFRRLPGTRVEGVQVARLLGQEPLLDGAVLDGALKAVRSPLVVHIATHGYFIEDPEDRPSPASGEGELVAGGSDAGGPLGWLAGTGDPLLRSGLALAGVNTALRRAAPAPSAEDGMLTARDIAGLDLLGTALVVLSACNTGRGQIQVGEGVFGMRRAFAVAGARALVMSLWKVPDTETQQLMGALYRNLVDGATLSGALQEARCQLKDDGHGLEVWGAFFCEGDPAGMPVLSARIAATPDGSADGGRRRGDQPGTGP